MTFSAIKSSWEFLNFSRFCIVPNIISKIIVSFYLNFHSNLHYLHYVDYLILLWISIFCTVLQFSLSIASPRKNLGVLYSGFLTEKLAPFIVSCSFFHSISLFSSKMFFTAMSRSFIWQIYWSQEKYSFIVSQIATSRTKSLNPFHATDLFWYPLIFFEVFRCFQGVSKEISGIKWVNL